ncbi:MAG: ribose 5-phosphate isomerase B [Defluviitaleaceae bacterium]|nr:ribose 5-phosphate isomerase B [Defluviitaleaceae bacterium]
MNKTLKLAITNDHASVDLKNTLLSHLKEKGVSVADIGSNGEKADYPEYAFSAANAVIAGEYDLAVLLCGTGAGMCIAANKVRGIRAVVCSEPYTARLCREHNNAQIICIGSRVVGIEMAKMIVDCFLEAKFEGGRHESRVNLIVDYENAPQ